MAPATAVHEAPLESQCCHWKAYVIGVVPLHEPADAVSVCPDCAVPLTTGAAVLAGGVPLGGGGVPPPVRFATAAAASTRP